MQMPIHSAKPGSAVSTAISSRINTNRQSALRAASCIIWHRPHHDSPCVVNLHMLICSGDLQIPRSKARRPWPRATCQPGSPACAMACAACLTLPRPASFWRAGSAPPPSSSAWLARPPPKSGRWVPRHEHPQEVGVNVVHHVHILWLARSPSSIEARVVHHERPEGLEEVGVMHTSTG